jgi:hypothetical protein
MKLSREQLRDLDRQVVPEAARRLRSGLDAATRARRRGVGAVRSAAGAAAAAAQRVDERWAGRGPLALLRDVPQLALLLVAVVFVSGAAAAVYLADDQQPPAMQAGGPTSPVGDLVLGVAPGEDVEGDLQRGATILAGLVEQRPDGTYLALVHLQQYLPVARADALVEGVEPRRAYLRAPDAGPTADVLPVPLSGPNVSEPLRLLCELTAKRKSDEAEQLSSFNATIEGTTPEEQAARADNDAQVVQLTKEALAFGGECATLFAVVVEGTARNLLALGGRDGVRGIEVASAGAELDQLEVAPLLPGTTGTAPTGNER